MTTIEFTTTTPQGAYATAPAVSAPAGADVHSLSEVRSGLKLVQLHDGLVRVTRPTGEVLGYVESFQHPDGERFRAKRFLPRQRRFIEIGEFWSRSDATDCFRFA
ncbi:hypothetical protein EDF46_1969 [Frondihabitans sp. PhB188]|uniref:hypothetical protein n=1 Tax=Frondihabitans sp. PhB188 TaxID=2485200 RepID=UPI000FC2F9CE|nr:hypothetical protein [Frondihabitans sp. PhB188]ROQ38337.1 hypothetical protein EDF46_1969 [Frondihabitans sp. PhB188]